MYRGKAEIVEIVRETHDTKTYRLKLESGAKLDFQPGQFVVMVIPQELGGGPKYSRAYSIASSPTEDLLELTMNVVGEVTKKMDSFETGVKVNVQGPFGHFVLKPEEHGDIVLIAGGTGIAPFRSMWRYIYEKKLPNKVYILFSNKTEADIIYHKELGQLQNNGAKVHVTVTREEADSNWQGPRGRIDEKTIRETCGSLENKTFFICGSNKMNDEMTQTLLALGIAKEKIITEKWGEY